MLLEPASQPGSAWLAIVSRPNVASFAEAFTSHVTLEATALAIPLRGAGSVYEFFYTTRSMYDRIAFVHEMRSDTRVCLEWEGVFQGKGISGATILTYASPEAIERIRLFHYPYGQLNAFSAGLAHRRALTTGQSKHTKESIMKMSGNTILITGGSSGIGRALAEAFHKAGNQVIITGRRMSLLKSACDANPGMAAVELDVRDPEAIRRVTAQIVADHPALNVLINNAGIMELDDVAGAVDEEMLVATVTTNLGGPIRMSGALVGHLKKQKNAVIINVSSILGFVPLVPTAAYSATKAALHSYTLSQRYRLRDIGIRVIEIAPPWVRTDLLNSLEEERAMPLDAFIEATMAMLATDLDEILVGQAPQMRANPGAQEHVWVNQFNDLIAAGPPLG